MKSRVFTLMVFVLMFTSIAQADYVIFYVTDPDAVGADNPVNPTNPVIDGDWVVWQDDRNSSTKPDIYGFIFSEPNEVAICTDSGLQEYLALSGDVVVWQDKPGTYRDIRAYDLFNRQNLALPNVPSGDSANQRYPDISGDRIVYEHYISGVYNVYVYDVNSLLAPTAIKNDSVQRLRPAVDQDTAVWMEARQDASGKFDIYRCDLSETPYVTFPVNVTGGDQWEPDISGDVVAWREINGSTIEIVAYDLTQGKEFLRRAVSSTEASPKVSNEVVVWHDHNGSDNDIYGYDIEEETLLAISVNSGLDEKNPSVSGRRVVWQRTGADIVGTDIPATTVIQVDLPVAGQMFLGGPGREIDIAWHLADGTAPSWVDIDYSLNSGSSWTEFVSAAAFTDYQHTWYSVPDVNEIGTCQIRIRDASQSLTEAKSGLFSIFQCDSDLTADLTGDCFVDMADMAALARQWLACGNPHDETWCVP